MYISIDRGRWVNLATCAQITFAENRITFSYGGSMPSTEWIATPEQQLELQQKLTGPLPHFDSRKHGAQFKTHNKKVVAE